MLKSLAIAICSLGLTTAAFAQSSTTTPPTTSLPAATSPSSSMTTGSTTKSAADCEASFKAADKNNDGKLDQTEITSAKSSVPTALQASANVTQSQFMTACQGK